MRSPAPAILACTINTGATPQVLNNDCLYVLSSDPLSNPYGIDVKDGMAYITNNGGNGVDPYTLVCSIDDSSYRPTLTCEFNPGWPGMFDVAVAN